MAGTKTAKNISLYGVHPSVERVKSMAARLQEKTGRSLQGWTTLAKKDGPKDEKDRRAWLISKYKLGGNDATWISERAAGKSGDMDSPEKYLETAVLHVEEQYAGAKEKLRPIFEELLELGKSMGADVKACPCSTMVPLYREHVFAQIKPTTNSRVDLGLALTHYKGKLPKRLVDTGGLAKKDRITHRFELTSAEQIDDEVKKWLKTAYELDK